LEELERRWKVSNDFADLAALANARARSITEARPKVRWKQFAAVAFMSEDRLAIRSGSGDWFPSDPGDPEAKVWLRPKQISHGQRLLALWAGRAQAWGEVVEIAGLAEAEPWSEGRIRPVVMVFEDNGVRCIDGGTE
jgi:hypothetical protein